jgi:hypothetical protein
MDDASELTVDKKTVSRSLRDQTTHAVCTAKLVVHWVLAKCAASSARVVIRA